MENVDKKKAEIVLKDLDSFIREFEKRTGKKVTEGARKYIEVILCEAVGPEKLN